MKTVLLGKTPEELKTIALENGLPAFAGKQVAQWLYQKKVLDIESMTNLSKAGRERLAERYEVGRRGWTDLQCSKDGTKKYLFPVACSHLHGLNRADSDSHLEESSIEAVMIPDEDRRTLCVSSQAGCKMGCKFCMTGRQGFHGHLSAGDILNQLLSVAESDDLTNVVFMGMGEPLDNYENVKRAIDILTADWGFGWSPKRITLSSIGVLPNLRRFLDETRCHLAISLHDPFGDERLGLMPVQQVYPLEEVLALIRQYDFTGQRRVSFEYTMFSGLNDDKRHADALVRLLRGLECRVNLIRFHKIPDFPYETSHDGSMELFRDRLTRAGITATIRASRGEDIYAACGMLAGEHENG
ncbi:MAG: 23S rRNA (adenine(2503)-C(2))-methyltransferase RlmN [Bacteroidales bacterium]|nr:23S rRNA (adenine(2503)-C(2))-methyltransferase RlmN [Bacteroidales bacterium]